jgi:hypothetical protein
MTNKYISEHYSNYEFLDDLTRNIVKYSEFSYEYKNIKIHDIVPMFPGNLLKLERNLNRINNNESIYTPILDYDSTTKKYKISDGRHRIVALNLMKYKYVKALVIMNLK